MSLKKSLFLFTAISVTASSAAFSTVTVDNLVKIPAIQAGFVFNIAALWLTPGASNLNYVIYNKELPTQSPTWKEREIQPSFSPGFEIGIGYIFPCAPGQDVLLTWTHLNTSDSDTTTAPDASFFLGPDYEIGPTGIPIRNARGNAKFEYDVVNLDVGQYVRFGQQLTMRLFAGLSGGFLQEKVKTTFSGTIPEGEDTPGPYSTTQLVKSKFTGIGPRFGVLANYDPCFYGFGVMGEAAMSLLIGSQNAKTNYISSSPVLEAAFGQTINNQFIKDETVYQVIPGFDAKLGINYRHGFTNNMDLIITAGYQAAVYVNAISQYLPASLVEPLETGGIFVATMSHTLSNYSVQGPFLDFALKF